MWKNKLWHFHLTQNLTELPKTKTIDVWETENSLNSRTYFFTQNNFPLNRIDMPGSKIKSKSFLFNSNSLSRELPGV